MKGEILLDARFADQGAGSTLAAVVGENMRAVSVRVNDVVGVGGFLLPGNRVDVVAAYRDRQDMLSETVVQNVKVLAIDQTAASDKNEPVVVRAVTLEVTPNDAEKLILAEQRGSIQLALRNPLDETVTKKVVAPVAAVVRTQAPPPSPTVAVIRGTELGKEVPKTQAK
jgi:pilus assembly protein CpaB